MDDDGRRQPRFEDRGDGPADQGTTVELDQRLGAVGTQACAAASGDDDDTDGHQAFSSSEDTIPNSIRPWRFWTIEVSSTVMLRPIESAPASTTTMVPSSR